MPRKKDAGCRRRRKPVYRLWCPGAWVVFRWIRSAGAVLVACAPRRDGAYPNWERIEEDWAVMPKKPVAGGPDLRPPPHAETSKHLDNFPLLRGYLCDAQYEDSAEYREPAQVWIRPGQGAFHITLKDPSTCSQIRVKVPKLEAAWGALEALLASDSPPWEHDQYAAARRPKKKR